MSEHDDDDVAFSCSDAKPGKKLPVCSCCLALAQVRMPDYDFDEDLLELHKPSRARSRGRKKTRNIFDAFARKAGKPEPDRAEERGKKDMQGATSRLQDAEPGTAGRANESDAESFTEEHEEPPVIEKIRQPWHGLDGLAVTAFGVALPLLSLSLMCLSLPKRLTLVLLNHPVETLVEMLLIAAVPLVNQFVWDRICKKRTRFTRASSLALGLAAGSSLFVAGVSIAAMFCSGKQLSQEIGSDFTTGFSLIALLSLLSMASSAFIMWRLRSTREFINSQKQVLLYSLAGALLSLLFFAGAEVRPWYVRYIEHMAASRAGAEARQGLELLRRLNPERELRMECSDPRAAGLAGLFLPVKQSSEHDLYFALTGKPYSLRDCKNMDFSSMPDDYLSRNVVGDPVPGLELSRSTLTGAIHPRTSTASMQWTFVLKNDTAQTQEARAELALPPGAVITGLTRWRGGEPDEASFIAGGKVSGTGAGFDSTYQNASMVTDLGHGRLLLQCYGMAAEEQCKVRLSMAVPLKPESPESSLVPMPEFVVANFSLEGEHVIRLQSKEKIAFTARELSEEQTDQGEYILSGTLSPDELRKPKLALKVGRDPQLQIAAFDQKAVDMAVEETKQAEALSHREQHDTYDHQIFLVFDPKTSTQTQLKQLKLAVARQNNDTVIATIAPHYVTESVSRVSASAPSRLIVVLDGSSITGQYEAQIRDALSKLPQGIPASLMIASGENAALSRPVPLKEGLEMLPRVKFIGGQNNLKSVVRASEIAGQTSGGAVLWIHGPQPASNQDIFIMSPYTSMPNFYELTLGSGDVDTVEFFKNHPEIGPFVQIPHISNSIGEDMSAFFKRWIPECSSYSLDFEMVKQTPAHFEEPTGEERDEMLVLQANKRCRALLACKDYSAAARIAVRYQFVSPVSVAIIQPHAVTTNKNGSNSQDAFSSQNSDQTVIYGVNTAGTVRVNNLANLEAFLNIIANFGEITLGIGGLILLAHGFVRGTVTAEIMGEEVEISGGQRIACGALLIVGGLILPGMINWFVSSARDANLFS